MPESSVSALEEMSRPIARKIPARPRANSSPSAMPSVAAISARTNASTNTDRVTWRREAPRARSSANSRLRWATRMEKVFTMMNPPTRTAITAKTNKNVEITPRNCPIWSWDSFATV